MHAEEAEVELPEGWVAAFDPTYKRMYYYDTKRRKSTWVKPPLKYDYSRDEDKPEGSDASSVSTSADETSELQDGHYLRAPARHKSAKGRKGGVSEAKVEEPNVDDSWVELYSKEHERKYFYNRVTKESVWKDPYISRAEQARASALGKFEANSEGSENVLQDVPALQTAWNQIEKAREDIKRERQEINGRLRTDAKLLKACLEEFARLRKDYAFTPENVPSEDVDDVDGVFEEKGPEDEEDGRENILDSLRNELDKYSRDIESRAAEMSRAHAKSADGQPSVQETSSESEEEAEDMSPEERKARHRRKMARRKENQGPDSLVLHMDMEEEIKGVVAEMKAREQAKAEARQVKEGDYYRVLGLKKTAKAGDLKRAYHKLMIKWHPDKNPENIKEATQNSNLVTDAYTVLSDPWEREIYDHLGLEHYLIHAKTLQAFKNYMWSGIRIKKHGRNGKRYGIRGMISFYPAKRRYLWLDFHCKSINTGPSRILEAQTDKERDSIKSVSMSSITEVKKGMATEVFLRTGSLSRQQHYLSIISPERTLDIETETVEQRNFLATRISLLVFDLQRNKEKLFNHYKENPIKKKKKKKKFGHGRRRF